VTVKYTWIGDANCDGVVDIPNDFFAYLDGLNGVGTGWSFGDFNLDGTIDVANDFFAYLDDLNMQTGPLGGNLGAVPEPATLTLLALGCLGLAARRRRLS